jgi:hypothetical protein
MLAILLGGAFITTAMLASSLRQRLHAEHLATARLALDSVATTLSRAQLLGVPLTRMAGLDELIASRIGEASGITAVRLLDGDNHMVWSNGWTVEQATPVIEAPIGHSGRVQALFVPPLNAGLFAAMVLVVLAVTAAVAVPLLQLARLFETMEEGFCARSLQWQIEAVCKGDLRVALRPAGVTASDERLKHVRDQILLLNEQYQRVTRLVGSLQRTEPDAMRRGRMDVLIETLHQRFQFAGEVEAVERRVRPTAEVTRCLAVFAAMFANLSLWMTEGGWYALIASCFAWGIGLSVGLVALRFGWSARLRLGFALTALANVSMFFGVAAWIEYGAHATAGLATSLAAWSAIEVAGGRVRANAVALGIASLFAGPLLGFAATRVIAPIADLGWVFGATAVLAGIAGVWLPQRTAGDTVVAS